jgi:energy-coupling factor transporter ATP-binding protein EcfA2
MEDGMPIVFDNVTFKYLHTRSPALEDINLSIEESTITAILGEVGSGKSTLLRMMNGLVPNYLPGHLSGKITVDGTDTNSIETSQLANKVNLVFDDPVLQIVSLTVRDDIQFGPANLGLTPEEIDARVLEALQRTRLTGYEDRNPRTLSGGEQQLLAIAGVLAMRSKYLALDDPIAMLDPLGKKQVVEAIRKLHGETGLTVVIAESGPDIEPLMDFVNQVVVLEKGHIVANGNPREVFKDQELVHQAGLRIPQVTEVAYQMGFFENGLPVTLDEGIEFVHKHATKPMVSKLGVIENSEQPVENNEKAIEIRNLYHTYPGPPPVEALRGVNLDIYKGELVALLGQNGSGKTTLSFHLVGVLKPTNDDAYIRVAGLDVANTSQYDLIQKVNYVFQNPANQLFCDTFAEEVSYGPEHLSLPAPEVEKRAKAALAQVGLGHLWEQSTFDISKSLETLLGLASVLSMEPEVLIVDEPTGGLDPESAELVMESLVDLNSKGQTIVIITHDMALAAKYTKRVIVLQDGKILMDGPTAEVFSKPEELAVAMLEPPQITQLGQKLVDVGLPKNILTVEDFVDLVRPALSEEEV